MSEGPHAAAVRPPDAERCPHYHWQAENKPSSKNPNPDCHGRCVFYAGHPHPHGGNRDPLEYQSAPEYNDNRRLCEVCSLWVRDWGMTG